MELNIENLMNTAIQEMENGQHTEASKHFDMVVITDASNIDAPFFRAYCNCYDIQCLVSNPLFQTFIWQKRFNVCCNKGYTRTYWFTIRCQ